MLDIVNVAASAVLATMQQRPGTAAADPGHAVAAESRAPGQPDLPPADAGRSGTTEPAVGVTTRTERLGRQISESQQGRGVLSHVAAEGQDGKQAGTTPGIGGPTATKPDEGRPPSGDGATPPTRHIVTCDVSATSGTSLSCAPRATVATGSTGAVSVIALGGASGAATSQVSASAHTRAAGDRGSPGPASADPASTARSGTGGGARSVPTSGSTGAAEAAASCTMNVSLTALTVRGDVSLRCQAVAIATSGASGGATAIAAGGFSGAASSAASGTASSGSTAGPATTYGGAEASAAPVSIASTGAGGGAVSASTSGATGAASATATCTLILLLTHVHVTGDVFTVCIPVTLATSGRSGAVIATATGGRSGPAGSIAVAVATSGWADGNIEPAEQAERVGGSGAVLAAPTSAATTGAGGLALADAASGVTGLVVAVNSCSIAVLLIDSTVDGQLRISCQQTSQLVSGSSGSVTSGAVGGGSGLADSRATSVATRAAIPVLLASHPDAGRSGRVPGDTRAAGGAGPAIASPSSTAQSGSGGFAAAWATSGPSGPASAVASCALSLVLSTQAIEGDVALVCLPAATATSGNSGSVSARAQGGDSGVASSTASATASSGDREETAGSAAEPAVSAPGPVPAVQPRLVAAIGPAKPALGQVVASDPASRPVARARSLPATGVPTDALAGLGVALLGAGTTVLMAGRRRV